jgi:hypothetical protein
MGIALALLIGFRWKVGGDWGFEHGLFRRVEGQPLFEALQKADPGFAFIGWLFAETGLNVWTLNLTCGTIFTIGLLAFCRQQPNPWLALVVAIPYLVIVVAMGYSRQSVAIGFVMLGLVALQAGALVRFLVFMALATSVHVTAALLIPIGILASRKQSIKTLLVIVPAGLALFTFLLQAKVDNFVGGYIEAEYQSSGALIRVMMNALPAALFFVFRARMGLNPASLRLWSVMSLIALAFIGLLAISPSSTAVDRMALYFIPIQLFVWNRLPQALTRSSAKVRGLINVVILYSLTVLTIWLNFADNSYAWLPYQLFPYDDLWGTSTGY